MNAPPVRGPHPGKPFDFQITRRVEFCDTDLAGIMHFSNFFRFMEAAETGFLRSLGLSILLSRCGLEVCLPRVHAECDYFAPLYFEDEVLVHLLVERKSARSLTYQFRFCRVGAGNGQPVARGRLVLACASRLENGTLKGVALPSALADRIHQAPARLLAEGMVSPYAARTFTTAISGDGESRGATHRHPSPRASRPSIRRPVSRLR